MLGNLFKKKPTFTPAMQELFVKINLALPHRFHFLQKQLTEGIIKGIKKPEGQRYQLRLDIPLLNKYEDKKGRNFLIENIVIQSVETSSRRRTVERQFDVAGARPQGREARTCRSR